MNELLAQFEAWARRRAIKHASARLDRINRELVQLRYEQAIAADNLQRLCMDANSWK